MTEILAELGSCHDANLTQFVRLIDLAADAGCTHAKAQFWSSVPRMVERRGADAYREVYARYQMPVAWLAALRTACERRSLIPACSVYLPEDVATVAPYVEVLKVASFEAEDDALLRTCVATGKRLIVSTGMMDDAALARLYNRLDGHGDVLHCVSSYPCPPDALHLSLCAPDFTDGLSDHSAHVLTGAVAVAIGARILEVHLRLADTDPQNPDYATALGPEAVREYVANVRLAERMLGDPVKRVQTCEAPMTRYRVTP